jgi:threonine/homoserine efflux transporter RhtA
MATADRVRRSDSDVCVLVRSAVHIQTGGSLGRNHQTNRALAIGDIMAAVVWVIIGLLLLRALFKPNPP